MYVLDTAQIAQQGVDASNLNLDPSPGSLVSPPVLHSCTQRAVVVWR